MTVHDQLIRYVVLELFFDIAFRFPGFTLNTVEVISIITCRVT